MVPISDCNPGLPPVGRILNKNKFILEIDPVLKKLLNLKMFLFHIEVIKL